MPSEHGTRSRYVQGCRSDYPATPTCTEVHVAYSNAYNRKRTERLKAEGMTARCAIKGCPWARRGDPDAVLALQRAHRASHGIEDPKPRDTRGMFKVTLREYHDEPVAALA